MVDQHSVEHLKHFADRNDGWFISFFWLLGTVAFFIAGLVMMPLGPQLEANPMSVMTVVLAFFLCLQFLVRALSDKRLAGHIKEALDHGA